MPHFSRLTDIVTCNLTEILSSSEDPAATLREIIAEMEEGLSACRRTVRTSAANHQRIKHEVDQHRQQVQHWIAAAKQALSVGDEPKARNSLTRKVELEGLIDGLIPEMEAADSTQQHMLRIQKALEARQADAARRLAELTGDATVIPLESTTAIHAASAAEKQKQSEIEAQMEALRRELGN